MRIPRAEPVASAHRLDGRLVFVLACQLALTLAYFSPRRPLEALWNGQPLISGRYPTEIDSMVRRPRWFAELAADKMYLSPPHLNTQAGVNWSDHSAMRWQKLRLLVALAFLPIVPAIGLRVFGVAAPTRFLTAAAGVIACWSLGFRPAITSGLVEPLVQGCCAAALVAMTVRTGNGSWPAFVLLSLLGAWLDPFGWLAAVPVLLACDAIRWIRTHDSACMARGLATLFPVFLELFTLLLQSGFRWHEVSSEIAFQLATGRLIERFAAPLVGAAIGLSASAVHSVLRRMPPVHPSNGARLFGGAMVVAGGVCMNDPPRLLHWTADWGPSPVNLALSAPERLWIERLQESTDVNSRILWERGFTDPSWLPYLPRWANRHVVAAGLRSHALDPVTDCMGAVWEGRPISEWSDRDLDALFRRLNVGWIRCEHPDTLQRLAAYRPAQQMNLSDSNFGQWFVVTRPKTWLLRGMANIESRSSREMVLTDLVPEGGVVALGFARPTKCQSSPTSVIVEDDPDPLGGPSLLRLRTSGPVSRVTLRW